MPVQLTRNQIDQALPNISEGLEKYKWLQHQFVANLNSPSDTLFRRRYNNFYRVRRNTTWQSAYFTLLGRARREALKFNAVLEALRMATNRLEASFASKLIATIDPNMPVIDKFVLKNVGLVLPSQNVRNRAAAIVRIYSALQTSFNAYLQSPDGQYLVSEFNRIYPNAAITDVKKLDLVLWKTRT